MTSPEITISLTTQDKLDKVLKYLSDKYPTDLTDATLETYAATDNLRMNKTIESVKFDLYFTKYLTDTLVR